MAIISTIGRRSWQTRALIYGIYAVLILGSLTMVYPFMLMVVGTSKSGVDTPEAELIPKFYVDDLALYRKDAEGFFNENLGIAQNCLNITDPSFRHVSPPEMPNAPMAAEWGKFIAVTQMSPEFFEPAYMECPVSRNSQPFNLRHFKSQVLSEHGNIEGVNQALGTEFVSMVYFRVFVRRHLSRMMSPGDSPFEIAFRKFKQQLPREQVFSPSVETFYRTEFLQSQYTRDIAAYNQAHGTAYGSWRDVRLPRRYPEGDAFTDSQRRDWEVFVRGIVNLLWLRADPDAVQGYRKYLEAKYLGNVGSLNTLHHSSFGAFDEVPLPAVTSAPKIGAESADWDAYVRGWDEPGTDNLYKIPIADLRIHCVDFMFQDYLAERHGKVENLNAAAGTSFSSWSEILPPQRDFHYLNWFLPNRRQIRWEFAVRNFIAVNEFVLLQGRALFNTFVFCALTIICSLIVNPLAAYALSRYKPPSAYKVLLFLMMTMAFPPMVTQIPNFLMLRELGLLNTFAALILPGMANGYSIFLLKGFFDSLPQELYESAEIDGAGEFCIFWQITMSLSTPILAVIALNAFNAAYGNFMMALLVCQDQNMWTLMPWLYQLQMGSGQGLIFASLVVAAVPTFLVFVFCQNIIMRGIVVPVEK